LDHYDQLIAYFADIHRQNETVPDVIIIFGLEFYANQSQVNIVFVCAVQVYFITGKLIPVRID
jgi:hypothetical protein